MAIEEPAYETSHSFPGFEVRHYFPCLRAETQVQGLLDEASTEGFRRLAAYIFGGNVPRGQPTGTEPVSEPVSSKDGQKIAMTAPVGTEPVSGGREWRVSFTMPREWTLETLPRPHNPSIRIVSTPERWVAVIRFSGRWTEALFQAKAAELKKGIQDQKLKLRSETPQYSRYNPPIVPWFLRRNEVWFEIEKPSP